MASVKVAVRVRPLNKRELDLQSQTIIHMKDKLTSITNVKVADSILGDSTRERVKDFTFDYSYWSACLKDSHYTAQEQVFTDLGLEVVSSAYKGYNACVFAYGQTGSGKTYTMMGNPDDVGLIPRIGKELFDKMSDPNTTYRTEVSYLEIYNEKVRDLLKTKKHQHTLRVREHPKDGPYVEGLSKHIVMNFSDIKELMDKGNASRTTAATNMNDVSSRSHAIFTVLFTQAKFSKDAPSEMHSKIHLVDLAGSERADQSGATGQRLKEGSSINKSLVTLGNVISALADMTEREHTRRSMFIPYRDSVLTWLLKDSLGGNAKTIMVAAISPASCNYAESLSTLRYANRAKNIINKPTVNEDSNVKLIRELREEITRLRTLLGGHIDNIVTPKVQEKLHENEARVKVLTDEWTGKWKEMANILKEERNLELRKSGLGVVLDSELPHLIGIDDDILSTGIMLYHLKDCHTLIGTADAPRQQDIVLSGVDMEQEHCIIEHNNGDVTLVPLGMAACTVNGIVVSDPVKLNQGAVILLGKTNMFRFNHPAEAAKLRAEFKTTRTFSMSRTSLLSQSMSDLYRSTENIAITTGWEMEESHKELLVALEEKRQQVEEMEERLRRTETDRLQEHGAAELELDERRRMLERLQHEAEMVKAEAQQTQREALEEVTRLKSRISDVEGQLDRRQEQELNDVNIQENGNGRSNGKCPSLMKAVAKLRLAINDEVTSLAKKENEVTEHAQKTKQKLSAELLELKAQHETRIRALEDDAHKLEDKKNQLLTAVEEAERELTESKDSLEQFREKDLKNIEGSREHLETLKNDHKLFDKLSCELDSSTREVLCGQYEQLTIKQRSVKAQEKDMYEIYKHEEAEILGRKAKTQEELVEEQRQLEADEIYMAECGEKLQLASESEISEERKNIEQIGLEKEQTRIREDKKALLEKKEEMDVVFKMAMSKLQQMRTQQIETLNEAREDLKALVTNWMTLLEGEISKNREKFTDTQLVIEDEERLLSDAVVKCDAAKVKRNDEQGILEKESDWLNDVMCKWRRHSEQAALEIERRTADTEEESRDDLQRITNHRKILDELSFAEHEELTEEDLEEKQQAFDRYKKLKEEELLEHSHKLQERQMALQLQHQTQLGDLAEERSQIEHRLQSLQSIEEQLRQRESELRERQQLHGQERQQQLDDLDLEKFRLRELEEQERINVLVEQEVKRRMFERRVQREKEQQLNLERERADHAQELNRIRNEHRREMLKLRQRYETGTPDSVGTCANTLPELQNGNAESRPNSARQLSRDMVTVADLSSLLRPLLVWIPSYVHRGSGFDTHFEFEVKFTVMSDVWTVFRRYTNFRELHHHLKERYPEVAALSFPPKRWFGNRLESVVIERRSLLEDYLQNMLNVLVWNTACPLHPSHNKVYSKQVLCNFHPFFKKGLFETGRHSTS